MFATVGFLHLAEISVEVGVGPTDELGALSLAILVAVPEINYLYSVYFTGWRWFWPWCNGWVNK